MPSSRRKRTPTKKLNLNAVLDTVFIFIFFLLMSATFNTIYQIASDVPTISDQEPPKDKKPPLALTIQINEKGFSIYTGVPSRFTKRIQKVEDKYNFEELHTYLIDMKKSHMKEDTVILEPVIDVTYEEIVNVMDAARQLQNTDEALYTKDKDGMDVKLEFLFNNIVFGNIQG